MTVRLMTAPSKLPMEAWLAIMRSVSDARTCLRFSRRKRFDDELRPFTQSGHRIAYPDAIYYVTEVDYDRAWASVQVQP